MHRYIDDRQYTDRYCVDWLIGWYILQHNKNHTSRFWGQLEVQRWAIKSLTRIFTNGLTIRCVCISGMSATFRNPETQLGLRQCASLSVASSQPGSPGRPERLQGDNLGDNQKPLAAPDQIRAAQLGARKWKRSLQQPADRQTLCFCVCPLCFMVRLKKKMGGCSFFLQSISANLVFLSAKLIYYWLPSISFQAVSPGFGSKPNSGEVGIWIAGRPTLKRVCSFLGGPRYP